jgi:hypothetical protein
MVDLKEMSLETLCKLGFKIKLQGKTVSITDCEDCELVVISLEEYRTLKGQYNHHKDVITKEEARKRERALIWAEEMKKLKK